MNGQDTYIMRTVHLVVPNPFPLHNAQKFYPSGIGDAPRLTFHGRNILLFYPLSNFV